MYSVYLETRGNKPFIFGGGTNNSAPSTDLSGVTFQNGTREGNQNIVNIAKNQVGNEGGQPYWSWYGFKAVEKGIEAWKQGDIKAFGTLMFESGYSSINSWETGSPELIALYEIMTHTPGIYGGRFSGAGFKGC